VKVIIIATIAVVGIAIGSYLILGQAGFSSAEQTSGAAVRLD